MFMKYYIRNVVATGTSPFGNNVDVTNRQMHYEGRLVCLRRPGIATHHFVTALEVRP